MQVLENWVSKATGITCHSAKVQPGYIFVAICGHAVDGNTFAQAAADRGALVIVSDCPDHLPTLPIPVLVVANARLALSELAAVFYDNPSRKLNLVGITGSNGKTTIACLLEHIFIRNGFQTGLIGTVRVNTGKNAIPSTLTTPDAVSLQHYLSQMLSNKVTHAAMEVSAQGVEMHRVTHVRFSTGILSNLCADHLDFHGNFANYLAAKTKFLELLTPHTPLIVNIDDPYCQVMASHFTGRLITVAVNNPADICARITHLTAYGSSFTLTVSNPLVALNGQQVPAGQYPMKLAIPGRHNIENALLAAAAALLQGLTPAVISQALADFRGVERRMDIFHIDGLTVVDDTALNPGSIEAVFDTTNTLRYRQLIVVNAIRGQRGPAINAANAATLACLSKRLPFELIITDSADQVGPPDTVTPEERVAFLSSLNTLKTAYTHTRTLSAAIKAALSHACAGDLIILIGAQGMDTGRQVLTAMIKSAKMQDHCQPQGYQPTLALNLDTMH
ncbi:UDP-N-acetylmuramoyl-L-alanyl-D-glutamate--L-lysine ligase [Sporomusa ovata DSM 2662]|uniref:UDP-N-acetylmuramoylalanyl-D-glutamate--2,6-diaminopimelate ligase n=1 Tax=Sporomusa ovata TaxID=2378 RepID=A0A0U1L025_9FIRM|nr:UDP-N-acetylmuramyl-tripeptide synthetase [Sporomusa ovata]EQB27959.1 UDP-N-acetylmuramoyl-L-alanyl-D-glutamate--2,6-diaminopimelate ligase [Sporomusa ovata DSM 2662]CQR72895.1 UDP-N-acetylmuramoylalanyl-D-glutamate--2,6-diaminopimelate ligase [Sporomusa ovata]